MHKKERVELFQGEESLNAYSKDVNDYYAEEKDLYLVSNNNELYKFQKVLMKLLLFSPIS